MSTEPLQYSDLDPDLIVWGNARAGNVIATGRGEAGAEKADAAWNPEDPSTGDIAYYHPDLGWTNAATGRPVGNER